MLHDPEYHVICPHLDCGEALHLLWDLGYTLSPSEAAPPVVSEAHTETWRVECSAGHVLLLPAPRGCGCDDPEGPTCPHNPDDFDWSDETSIFRDRDLARLRDIIDRIAPIDMAITAAPQ